MSFVSHLRKQLRQPWLYIALLYGGIMTWVRMQHWGEPDWRWALGKSLLSAVVMWLLLYTVFGKKDR